MARAAGMRVLRGEADASVREPMELWRGVYRSLGVEPRGDPALPAEERRWEHLESLAGALDLGGARPRRPRRPPLGRCDGAVGARAPPRALGDAPVALVATSRDHEPGHAPPRPAPTGVPAGRSSRASTSRRSRQLAAAQATSEPVDAVDAAGPYGREPAVRAGAAARPRRRRRDRRGPRPGAGAARRRHPAPAGRRGAGRLRHAARRARRGDVDAPRRRPPTASLRRWPRASSTRWRRTGVRFRHALLAEAAERLGRRPLACTPGWRRRGTPPAASTGGRRRPEHRIARRRGHAEIAVAAAVASPRASPPSWSAPGSRRGPPASCATRARRRRRVRRPPGPAGQRRPRPGRGRSAGWATSTSRSTLYQEAAELARSSSDLVLRARTEVGAAPVGQPRSCPTRTRLRRLEEALADLPAEELRLRAERCSGASPWWAAPISTPSTAPAPGPTKPSTSARRIGDPVLIAQALLNRTMSPESRAELDARLVVADEVVGLAERAGSSRPRAATGHQRRFCHHLNHGDVGAANRAPGARRAAGRAAAVAGVAPQHAGPAHDPAGPRGSRRRRRRRWTRPCRSAPGHRAARPARLSSCSTG